MSTHGYDAPATDPHARLRELLETDAISPEIAELRLAVLRQESPQALVQIDAVRADDTAVAVKAVISLPGGARHTAIAAADVDTSESWADQLEMQQAIAIARALDGLGHTTARLQQQAERPTSRPQQPAETPPAQPQQPAADPDAQPQQEASQQQPSQQTPNETDHLPEYSWNAFWQTMNARNITREQVEKALGKSVQETTPKEAVDALTAAGLLA